MVNEFPLGNVWGFFHKHQTRFPLCHIFLFGLMRVSHAHQFIIYFLLYQINHQLFSF